jgi:hypothetical protein
MKTLIIFLFSLTLSSPEVWAQKAKTPAKPKNVYVDKQGDTVTVLDYELRKKLNVTKEFKPSLVYDSAQEIQKAKAEMERSVLTNKQLNLGNYTVEKEVDLRELSQKLYGTINRWAELQVLNEDILQSSVLSPGMKLKYIIDEPKIKAPVPADTVKKP